MIKEQSTLSWYYWKCLKTEHKWTQIETMEEHIGRAGALERTVLNQSIETGDVNSAAINRVGPEVTSIRRVAYEVIPKEIPPPTPEKGSSGSAQESSPMAIQSEAPTSPGAGGEMQKMGILKQKVKVRRTISAPGEQRQVNMDGTPKD